jgi:hypothetical protein
MKGFNSSIKNRAWTAAFPPLPSLATGVYSSVRASPLATATTIMGCTFLCSISASAVSSTCHSIPAEAPSKTFWPSWRYSTG